MMPESPTFIELTGNGRVGDGRAEFAPVCVGEHCRTGAEATQEQMPLVLIHSSADVEVRLWVAAWRCFRT